MESMNLTASSGERFGIIAQAQAGLQRALTAIQGASVSVPYGVTLIR